MKYKLTFWQRLELVPMWFLWFFHADKSNRKSWHEVKKGMEKHEHKFTKEYWYGNYRFLQCDHEGCTLCHDPSLDSL